MSYLIGGIPTPLKNMKVNWDNYSQYMGKIKHVPNHQPERFGKLAPYIITPLVGNMELGSSEPLPPIKEMFHQCSPIDGFTK